METAILLTVATYVIWFIEMTMTTAAVAALYKSRVKNSWCLAIGLAIRDFATLQIHNGMKPTTNAGVKTGVASTFFLGSLLAAGGLSTALFSPSTEVAPTLFEAVTPWISYNWETTPTPPTEKPQIVFTLPDGNRNKRQIVWEVATPASSTHRIDVNYTEDEVHQNGTMFTDIEADYDNAIPMIAVNYTEDEAHQNRTMFTDIEADYDNATPMIDVNYNEDKTTSISTETILIALAAFAAVIWVVGMVCGLSLACAVIQACANRRKVKVDRNELQMTTI